MLSDSDLIDIEGRAKELLGHAAVASWPVGGDPNADGADFSAEELVACMAPRVARDGVDLIAEVERLRAVGLRAVEWLESAISAVEIYDEEDIDGESEEAREEAQRLRVELGVGPTS